MRGAHRAFSGALGQLRQRRVVGALYEPAMGCGVSEGRGRAATPSQSALRSHAGGCGTAAYPGRVGASEVGAEHVGVPDWDFSGVVRGLSYSRGVHARARCATFGPANPGSGVLTSHGGHWCLASVSGPGCHAAPGYVGALVYRNPRRIPTVSPLAGHGVVMAGGMMLQAKVPGRCATGGVGKRAARAADRIARGASRPVRFRHGLRKAGGARYAGFHSGALTGR